ncbi:MAG: hypothetical protein JW934_22890 [Anaerolineae bacterium]|nr:hypothetical protein [Anaerolineae bacterium]
MKRWCVGMLITALLWASTGFIAQGLSAQSGAMLKVAPQALKLNVGDTATFDLAIEQIKGLYGIEVHLTFDPQVLQVVDADPGKEGVQLEAGTLPAPDFVVLNTANNVAGTADYAVTQLPPNQPADGDGIIARITMRAVKSSTTLIRIERFLLADTSGNSIKATSQHGQVQVGGDPAWLLVAAAAFLIVTAGVAIGFAIIRRK